VAERPDRRAEGVVARDRPVGVHAEDLAVQGAAVLGALAVAGVAGADVELAVRPERDAAAVVVAGAVDAGDDRSRAAAELEAHDAVVTRARVVGVDEPVA
jgi:hypothetical protein